MQLKTSYKQILALSTPIMLGSAVQNVIALTDVGFLMYFSPEDFKAITFIGSFYLIIAAIGYGFSRGGQIMIARRMGEQRDDQVGRIFYSMVYFEMALAILMFLFMYYGAHPFLSWFADSNEVLIKSLQYLEFRSWGVFFSYVGVAIISLYTGIARPLFIVVDTMILAIVNMLLNYGLIAGKWGLPAMGIAGAGLASTIAEVVAFVVFILYIFYDKKNRTLKLFTLPKVDFEIIKQQYYLSAPIVAQAVVGLGSAFVFIGLVENLGEKELEITGIVRILYLILSIPCWGFATGINTLVSHFIGAKKRQAVFPIISKTAWICWLCTMVLTLPIALFPDAIFDPILSLFPEDLYFKYTALVQEAKPIFLLLIVILTSFSVGGIYFNGLTGAGATFFGLKLQMVGAVIYLGYIYFIVEYTNGGLFWAWASEIFYWLFIMSITIWYLKSRRWYELKV